MRLIVLPLRSRFAGCACFAFFILFAIGCRKIPPGPAPVSALKILVEADGLYSLSQRQLQDAGLQVEKLDPKSLQLSHAGEPVPYLVLDGALIFYGKAPTSRYTKYRAYILRREKPGSTMATATVGASGHTRLTQVPRVVHLEKNWEYASDANMEGGAEPWFWETIQPQGSITLPFSLPAVADGAGRIELNFYGATHHPKEDPDHSVGLVVNGSEQATITWEGQNTFTASAVLPVATLRQGENQLRLDNVPEDYLDIMKLNWIRLVYHSEPRAVDGRVAFSGVEGRIALQGFSDKPLILDVADADQPVLLNGWNYENGVAEIVVDESMQIVAVASEGYGEPVEVLPLRESDWDSPQQRADLIIITTDELAPALTPLAAAREKEGLDVVVVPVAEIYDTFGFGEATPDSINHFLTYAYQNWQAPQPRYLLLVGEATSDYRNYLSDRPENPVTPPANLIPPYLVAVNYGGETVSDARLADVDGDLKPDLAVGRWPADTLLEVEQLVERTLAYENGAASTAAIFAADGTSSEFQTFTQRMLSQSEFPIANTSILNGPSAQELAEVWSDGAWLLTYVGHGSLELWGKEEVFSSAAIKLLQDDASPIVVQLTCLSGLFAHPEMASLSETLLLRENGPVLLVGATSLTLSAHQEPFAVRFLQALQNPEIKRIGDALQAAKEGLDVSNPGLREISDTFGLLGDPSAPIMRP